MFRYELGIFIMKTVSQILSSDNVKCNCQGA